MNKTLILVLAVCLVSAHAFVKRDAPAAAADANKEPVENFNKQIQDLVKTAENALKTTFSDENMQKIVKEAQQSVNKLVETIQKTAGGAEKKE